MGHPRRFDGWATRRSVVASTPHLKNEMWGTRFCGGSDVGHLPLQLLLHADKLPRVVCFQSNFPARKIDQIELLPGPDRRTVHIQRISRPATQLRTQVISVERLETDGPVVVIDQRPGFPVTNLRAIGVDIVPSASLGRKQTLPREQRYLLPGATCP